MSQLATSLLIQRRKRLVGSVMNYLEKNVYPRLTQQERDALRLKMLGDIDAYHDVSLDLIKASVSDGAVLNDQALEILARIDQRLRRH